MTSGRSLLLAAAIVLASATGWVEVQAKKPGAKKPAPAAKPPSAQVAKPASSGDTGSPALEPDTTPKAPSASMTGKTEVKTSAAREKEPSDAGVTVLDKDGGTKQFRFTETDIEGRLKAPQLV